MRTVKALNFDATAYRMPKHLPMTVTVLRIAYQNAGSEVALRIALDNGEQRELRSLPLTVAQYCELRVQKGEISEEEFERIEAASELCQAIRAGEHLLSYGPNSEKTLTRKLMQRGYSREMSATATQKLCEMGLIDEYADVRREVEKCLAKLWGAKRISAHLWSKGFSSEAIATMGELTAEVDFSYNCARLINKHYGGIPTDSDELRRMTAGLSRYGYSIGEIKTAIKTLKES